MRTLNTHNTHLLVQSYSYIQNQGRKSALHFHHNNALPLSLLTMHKRLERFSIWNPVDFFEEFRINFGPTVAWICDSSRNWTLNVYLPSSSRCVMCIFILEYLCHTPRFFFFYLSVNVVACSTKVTERKVPNAHISTCFWFLERAHAENKMKVLKGKVRVRLNIPKSERQLSRRV